MALRTDDIDLNDVRFRTHFGSNGDYYISLIKKENGLFTDELVYRMSMSGGQTSSHSRVRLAMSELHNAMEEANLNLPACDDGDDDIDGIISESDHQLQEDLDEWNKERMSGLSGISKELKRHKSYELWKL